MTSVAHASRGPEGEELAVDIAVLGGHDAERTLVIVSGTHGVEGYAGSACQVAWLSSGIANALRRGVAVILIHALNPFGVAYVRRENEDNVDLNRNFLAHGASYPPNDGYERIHQSLLLGGLNGSGRLAADMALAALREDMGEEDFVRALAGGQYTHPDGLYFGGHAPAWSGRVLQSAIERLAHHTGRVCVIDIHTGLGEFGAGAMISLDERGAPGLARAQSWFGDGILAPFAGGTTGLPRVQGTMLGAWQRGLVQSEVTAVVLEFGTYSLDEDLRTHREDNWLWRHRQAGPEVARAIKANFLEYACPAAAGWRSAVLAGSAEVFGQAIDGLCG